MARSPGACWMRCSKTGSGSSMASAAPARARCTPWPWPMASPGRRRRTKTPARSTGPVARWPGNRSRGYGRGAGPRATWWGGEWVRGLWGGGGSVGNLMGGLPLATANPVLGMMRQWLSPYQTNPLDINPLRGLLEREIDFALLRAAHGARPGAAHRVPHGSAQGAEGTTADGPKVFVCATNVRTGRSQIFSGPRLSVDAVMASACLPLLFQAVEIDGEHYWDGGYSGNPALHPLIYQTGTSDILLVQINPIEHPTLPHSGAEIIERINEVTFNASLLAELRAIEFVRRLLAEGKLDPRRYKSVRMHRIDGGAVLQPFAADSKMRADLAFVRQLFALGREAGQQWLQAHRQDVGLRPSIKIADNA